MSYSLIRGLGVVDPPESTLLLSTGAGAQTISESQPTKSGKPEPPPSWKKRNPLTEYKKNLARKGTFPEGEGEEKYADGSVYKGERSHGKLLATIVVRYTPTSVMQVSGTAKAVFGGPIVVYMLVFSVKDTCTDSAKCATLRVANTTAN
jgi:hypothetical protein